MGSRLSESRLLAHVAMFLTAAGKRRAVTAVLLQEKGKLLYERLFEMLQRLCHPVRDLDYDLQRLS